MKGFFWGGGGGGGDFPPKPSGKKRCKKVVYALALCMHVWGYGYSGTPL